MHRQSSSSGYKHIFILAFALIAMMLFIQQPATAAQIINVKKAPYNAVGDGATDDSAALQAAFNAAAASPGSTVLFPAGSYLHNATLTVSGTGTSVLSLNKANTILTGARLVLDGERTSLSSFTFNSHGLIQNNSNQSKISNCSMQRLDLYYTNNVVITGCNFTVNSFDAGISAHFGDKILIENCKFTAASYGLPIVSDHSSNLTIRQATITSPDYYSVYLYRTNTALVENCDVRNGSGINIYSLYCNNLTIRNNNLSGISSSAICQHPLYLYGTNAISVTNNKIRNFGLYNLIYNCPKVQFNNNSVSESSNFALLFEFSAGQISSNQISKCQGTALYAYGLSGSNVDIQGNLIKDCGLSGANSVIEVSNPYGNYNARVRLNTYSGNQQNLNYFIRCYVPSPPAIVQANITTTMLPTLVGP